MQNGVISNLNQAEQAALNRESKLKEEVNKLEEFGKAFNDVVRSYTKQHDAGYEKGIICTCCLCVWSRQILDRWKHRG